MGEMRGLFRRLCFELGYVIFCGLHLLSLSGVIELAHGEGGGMDRGGIPNGLSSLQELMVTESGGTIDSPADWGIRREEIKASLKYFEYGHIPPRPDKVVATRIEKRQLPEIQGREERMTLLIGSKERLPLRVSVYLPSFQGPFPVLIREEHALGHIEEVPMILARGYGFVEFAREDLDPDLPGVTGAAQSAYPEYDWATLAVWAWGAMRVVDYLESRKDIQLDKLGIVGHSRGGKMALLAGALDERFALVAPNGSGAGGAGSFVNEAGKCETLELITRPGRFGYWFHPRLRWFVGRQNQLPFDQHFVKALVAPRALICTEARGDLWANPIGTFLTSVAAQGAFDLLNVETRNGIHYRDGKHDFTAEDWDAILDFADWHLMGMEPEEKARFWKGTER
ncbi:MAG: hypothetical protein HOI66_16785 [Verrucomicrobia bacterium]|nr:hypothetical protein [Verrucomicrobiota bacterium]